jgi:hypothetical protein
MNQLFRCEKWKDCKAPTCFHREGHGGYIHTRESGYCSDRPCEYDGLSRCIPGAHDDDGGRNSNCPDCATTEAAIRASQDAKWRDAAKRLTEVNGKEGQGPMCAYCLLSAMDCTFDKDGEHYMRVCHREHRACPLRRLAEEGVG